ncbi:MAG TPA: GRP family sugar transporter, partial [Candidatus Kurthia intestinigallinarum]|nr:GRP family sugar transporter [Candidatus Kurthia intestinigallinarum]
MELLIAILPAIFWGSQVLITMKIGGGAYSQTLGTAIGALAFSLAIYFTVQPELSLLIFGVGFVSGLFWAIGQGNQLIAVNNIGVSKAMPISTGLQLVGTALFGVIVFHEWKTTTAIILGVIAIACILVGIIFTSKDDHDEE